MLDCIDESLVQYRIGKLISNNKAKPSELASPRVDWNQKCVEEFHCYSKHDSMSQHRFEAPFFRPRFSPRTRNTLEINSKRRSGR
jgi:hypothetical protein